MLCLPYSRFIPITFDGVSENKKKQREPPRTPTRGCKQQASQYTYIFILKVSNSTGLTPQKTPPVSDGGNRLNIHETFVPIFNLSIIKGVANATCEGREINVNRNASNRKQMNEVSF